MRHLLLTAVLFAPASFAQAGNYKIKLDWNKPSSLSDNIVLQCDDVAYSGVELTVPGHYKSDFLIDISMPVTRDGVPTSGCGFKIQESAKSTTYLIDADGGGCSVNVYELHPNPGKQRGKVGRFEINDAC